MNGDDITQKSGIPVYLPSTFQGSPRAQNQNYQDALTICSRAGTIDLLLTFTCNPNWREIQENLQYGEHAANRPDLIARVFRIKLKELTKDITVKHIFG